MRSLTIRPLALSFLLFVSLPLAAYADSVTLGTAGSYAVLAGSTVTNTGSTVLSGDLGVSPGCALTGFSPGIVNGTTNACNAASAQAQGDLTKAYKALTGLSRTATLTGTDLGGLTLKPGVYFFATSAQLSGALTLNNLGNPNARFVFQIGSTLTTASNSSVIFSSGLKDKNVYWQVGSSATLGTGTAFAGKILALTSITLNNGASINCGAALARNGAVTLINNLINSKCGRVATVPEPSTISFMVSGLAVLAGAVRLKMRV